MGFIGYYNYTVILTYIGMATAIVGSCLAMGGNLKAAAICLMVSGACDMFDGTVARTKKDRSFAEKRFGIQIDSLSDVICFGVFPAVMGYCGGMTVWWQIAILAYYVLAGLIRLAYFNVTEEIRQDSTDAHRTAYEGMPISTVGLLVPLVFVFRTVAGAAFPIICSIALFVFATAFIARFKFPKFGMKGSLCVLAAGVATLVFLLTLN